MLLSDNQTPGQNQRREVKIMQWRSSLLVSALLIASGCNGRFTLGPPAIPGSGIAKDETRPIEAFHALDTKMPFASQARQYQGCKSEPEDQRRRQPGAAR